MNNLTPHPLEKLDGCINTASGNKIDLLNPKTDQISINDIAIALGNTSHFGGQTKRFFSVAQHSWLVAEIAPEHLKKEALMHDAAEAYLGDMIKPLKILLPEYQRLEEQMLKVIFERYHLDYEKLIDVKRYDKKIQQLEYDFFYGDRVNSLEIYLNRKKYYRCWTPEASTSNFLSAFNVLFKH